MKASIISALSLETVGRLSNFSMCWNFLNCLVSHWQILLSFVSVNFFFSSILSNSLNSSTCYIKYLRHQQWLFSYFELFPFQPLTISIPLLASQSLLEVQISFFHWLLSSPVNHHIQLICSSICIQNFEHRWFPK